MSRVKKIWQSPVGRRTFLGGLGAGAAALTMPFMRRRAFGAQGTIPNLVVIHMAHGIVPQSKYESSNSHRNNAHLWNPSGSERDFSLGEISGILNGHKSDLVFCTGLDYRALGSGSKAHSPARQTSLRAYGANGGSGKPSIDQHVAAHLRDVKRTGHDLDILNLGLISDHSDSDLVWRDLNGGGVKRQDNPGAAFDSVFSSGFDITSEDDLAALRTRKKSVLDFTLDQSRAVQNELCGNERELFDAHVDSIQRAEASLARLGQCKAPEGGYGNNGSISVKNIDDDDIRLVSEAHADLIVASLACQMTPVVSYGWAMDVRRTNAHHFLDFESLGVNVSDADHHNHAHGDKNKISAEKGATQESYRLVSEWYIQQLDMLLTKMKNMPTAGGNLLDDSIVLFTNEYKHGWSHSLVDLPFLVAGGGAGQIETGRWIDSSNGRGHGDLLTTIARLMGDTNLDKFGDKNHTNGPMTELADV